MSTPFGKMLRFNDDGSIPTDNPFYGSTTGVNRSIWALGLRNPFTFGFQPVTGRMFINDVGQSTWEEDRRRGSRRQLRLATRGGVRRCANLRRPDLRLRAFQTTRRWWLGFSIVGAAFYGPAAVLFPPEYQGSFFFADYVSGWVNRLDTSTATRCTRSGTGRP